MLKEGSSFFQTLAFCVTGILFSFPIGSCQITYTRMNILTHSYVLHKHIAVKSFCPCYILYISKFIIYLYIDFCYVASLDRWYSIYQSDGNIKRALLQFFDILQRLLSEQRETLFFFWFPWRICELSQLTVLHLTFFVPNPLPTSTESLSDWA
jgi:hypothetical protein